MSEKTLLFEDKKGRDRFWIEKTPEGQIIFFHYSCFDYNLEEYNFYQETVEKREFYEALERYSHRKEGETVSTENITIKKNDGEKKWISIKVKNNICWFIENPNAIEEFERMAKRILVTNLPFRDF